MTDLVWVARGIADGDCRTGTCQSGKRSISGVETTASRSSTQASMEMRSTSRSDMPQPRES